MRLDEAGAFPRDRQARRFLDPSRLHALNHKGDHFQVVGPLNISCLPQGQPVIFQAGDSEQGRDLGATIGGYNIHIGHPSQFRRFTGEVVPILRERGLVRAEYESSTLRGHRAFLSRRTVTPGNARKRPAWKRPARRAP